jgi:YesN/AraC family two-component response regulator
MVKILIIDDEAPIRKMLKKVLEKNNFEVVDAQNGNQGIILFKEHHPDLVITDLIMPEKEGLETIRELKKINPDVEIIAISGGGSADPKIYLKIASNLGAIHTFTKPVDNEILLSKIKELLA